MQNGGSAKTAQSVRRPPGNLGQRAPSQPLQDNVSQSTSRRGLRPRRTWGHLSPGPCRMHASLSDHEVLDSAGAVREVVGNGGSGHRFRAEIWVREEDACKEGGVLALSATRPRLHDSMPMSSPVHANPLPDRTIAARTSDCSSWPSANIELMLLMVVAVAVAQRFRCEPVSSRLEGRGSNSLPPCTLHDNGVAGGLDHESDAVDRRALVTKYGHHKVPDSKGIGAQAVAGEVFGGFGVCA